MLLGHALVHYCTNFSNGSGKLRCVITIKLKAENMFVGHMGYLMPLQISIKPLPFDYWSYFVDRIAIAKLWSNTLVIMTQNEDWVIFDLNHSFLYYKQIYVNQWCLVGVREPVTSEYPSQRADITERWYFRLVCLKLLKKLSIWYEFETTWRKCDVIVIAYG